MDTNSYYIAPICICLSAKITIHNVVIGILHEPQKLRLPDIFEFMLSALEPSLVFFY